MYNENAFFIPLRAKQLILISAHLGHTKKLSHFLAGWYFYAWKSNVFIINLTKTFIFIKMGLNLATTIAKSARPFWFVTMNEHYAPHIVRYAHICGEPFNVYEWISGTLSNYRMILGWLSLLLFIFNKRKYKIRNLDKRNLVQLVGHLNKRIYNKISVRNFNKFLGRDMNKWGKSYNNKKFLRNLRKENDKREKQYEHLLEVNFAVWNQFYDLRTSFKDRRLNKWLPLFYSKRKYPINYKDNVIFKKAIYSKNLNWMAYTFFRKKLNPNILDLNSSNNYLYKNFRKKDNKKNFLLLKHSISYTSNLMNNINDKFEHFENFYDEYDVKKKFFYKFLFFKQNLLLERWQDRSEIFRKTTNKYNWKSKFFSIVLLKARKRLLAKIKKLKKNSSFQRAFKFNRWLSPFDPMSKTRKPGGGFVPTYYDNVRIIDEFAVSNTPFITLSDSNVVSTDITIPFPSNDDSIKCVLFFTYLLTKCIFVGKCRFLLKWKTGIVKLKHSNLKKKLIFLYNIDKKKYKNKKQELEDKDNIDNKLTFLIDDLISENLEKFNTKNEIKYKLATNFEIYFMLNYGVSYKLSFLETEIYNI